MWINKAQLIARKGREMTMESLVDEALERSGRWGCLAVDRVFNVFSASDPIGTRLNSTVDATYAKMLTSIPLNRAIKSILRTLPDTLEAHAPSTGLFGTWGRSSASTVAAATAATAAAVAASTSEAIAAKEDVDDDIPDDAEDLFSKEGGEEEVKRGFSFGKRTKAELEERVACGKGKEEGRG
jgi:hypothetical protein